MKRPSWALNLAKEEEEEGGREEKAYDLP